MGIMTCEALPVGFEAAVLDLDIGDPFLFVLVAFKTKVLRRLKREVMLVFI